MILQTTQYKSRSSPSVDRHPGCVQREVAVINSICRKSNKTTFERFQRKIYPIQESYFTLPVNTEIIYYYNNRVKQRIGIKAATQRGAASSEKISPARKLPDRPIGARYLGCSMVWDDTSRSAIIKLISVNNGACFKCVHV